MGGEEAAHKMDANHIHAEAGGREGAGGVVRRGLLVSLQSCGTVQYSVHATNAFYLEQQIE